jgi:5-methylcytosine-specific restriction enzyme subunit McrC
MPRRYVTLEDDLPMLRGRLNVIRQFSVLAASPNRIASRYDELSSDIALNQIMKAAVRKLLQLARAPENQRKLRELGFAYADVSDVPVEALRWDLVVLDRTNARWKELIALARLLLGDRFQTTSLGQGRGFSLLFEMNTLFEEYVGRCLRQVLAGTGLTVELQGGRRYCLSEATTQEGATGRQRFMTKPDIIIRQGAKRLLIIDTKWKRLANSIDDPKQGVSQADVYQMMAYGQIYDCPELMLLYPHHDELQCEEGLTSEHRITTTDHQLTTATIGLADLASVQARLSSLISGRLGLELTGKVGKGAHLPLNTLATVPCEQHNAWHPLP